MSKAVDLTIDAIIKKYEHRQQALRSGINIVETDSLDTARLQRGESGLSTPEFSFTVGKKEIGRKMQEEERIQRTMKKEEGKMREEASFSTDRELHVVLRQLEDAEQRLARSQRNFAEASRRCEQLLRKEKEAELEGKLQRHSSGELQARLAVLERENLNYRECIASKDSNLQILRQKLAQKNERLIQSQRAVSDLKGQVLALVAEKEKAKAEEDASEKEKQELIKRLKNELQTLQNYSKQRQVERKELLLQIQRGYRAHQEQLQVVRQSYIQVEEQYKEWINNCNAQKLALISQYQLKLSAAKNSIPQRKEGAFEQQLQRRQIQSSRLIALTAKQSQQLKSLRSEMESLQRVKTELVIKVSSLQNTLIDKTEILSSLEAAYSALQVQYRQQQQKGRQLRQRYNSVNRQFVELKGKCSILFQNREASKREGQNESAELIRVRKQLLLCREQLQKSRSNETALGVKLAQATKTVKDRLQKLQQQREQSLTELLAERLQNARLQEELEQTRQYLKRQYELSVQNTRKQLERQIASNSKTARGSIDPEKQQLYLQLRALQRKYQLLAEEIVTVDEVIGLAGKVKRRHEPLKKSHLQ